MSWEALRLTSRSPSELLHTLGPHGVDHLIRQALDVLWREYPEESRTFENVRRRAQEVFDRNMRVWSSIKKPTPQAFFDHLLPYAADGFVRQAMVLCWMMMPRTGGRDVKDVRRIIADIYRRNIEAWEADNRLFTGGSKRLGKRPPKPKAASPARPGKRPKHISRRRPSAARRSANGKRSVRPTPGVTK
jgi:hypothetical protein